MRKAGLFFAVFLLGFCFSSCTKPAPETAQDYYRWLNDEQNGCVQKQRVNGVELTVKYLPVDVLIAKEMEGNSDKNRLDSLRAVYRQTLTMVMTFSPDERTGAQGDIVFKDVQNKEAYNERMLTMNFGLEEQVSLHAGGKVWHPALSGLENTYGLESSRSVVLAFPIPDADREKIVASDWTLSYDDVLFDMGTLHFKFDRDQLNKIPVFPGL